MSKICFVTTGDIKNIATAKRALGLANPLSELGWDVSIIMEDTEENHHRCEMECGSKVKLYYYPHDDFRRERKRKDDFIQEIDPDYLYICAFVTRNIVGVGHRSKKLVEHCELQTGIPDIKGLKRLITYGYEYYSMIYADGLLNASVYLLNLYKKRARKIFRRNLPMLYYPYAFNQDTIQIKQIDYTNEKYKRFENKVNFVFLGSVTRNYGVFTILEAVKEVRSQYQDFQMLILGRGRHFEDALKYVSENGLSDFVYMPGFIAEEEISDYFSLAAAFVSPMNDTVQDWARCPSKLYLYLPYQKPVITCKIGEPFEVLKDEGNYYMTGNSHSMAQQMMEIIHTGKDKIKINPEEYTWTTRAGELNDWIEKTF